MCGVKHRRLSSGIFSAAVDLLEVGTHRRAKRRKLRAARCAPEQAAAELLFQKPDGITHGWLRHAATAGRSGEAAFLADGKKVTDLIRFHGHSQCKVFRDDS